MKTVVEKLKQLADDKYADFQAKLTPNIDRSKILGVRVPVVRKFAKEVVGSEEVNGFLEELPHFYYDENMLHGILLTTLSDFDRCVYELERFLPYVDNWAVCDVITPKVFGKKQYRDRLVEKIKEWAKSGKTYTVRFGIEMLMAFFLDENFKSEYLDIPMNVKSEEYYVNMMIAWFFATALAKQWQSTIPVLEGKKLSPWIHNKTIQKAIESYRITDEQKQYLRSLKV